MTPRNVSPTRRQAVLLAWENKCAVTDIDDLPLHVDHIIPLVLDGTNDFSNLIPVIERINLKKSGNRYPIPLENWLKFLAAGKVPECERWLARLNHKANPLPKDPSKINLQTIGEYLAPSKNWTLREMLALVRTYVRYGVRRLAAFAARVGKSLHSARMKLVWLGIYEKSYSGLTA